MLLVGPTNLLALLWSAAEVLQRHAFVANAHEIMKAATELYGRIRVVAGPLAKLGKSLNDSVVELQRRHRLGGVAPDPHRAPRAPTRRGHRGQAH